MRAILLSVCPNERHVYHFTGKERYQRSGAKAGSRYCAPRRRRMVLIVSNIMSRSRPSDMCLM